MTTKNRLDAKPEEPDWLPGLIIYELSTRAFTSPNGPESGTFVSLAERLNYLRDLGITGIWLTGHNWADNAHFYGIWTQYATIRPDVIDERLGTRKELQAAVKAAHACGIRVFLDVITHGVMKDSPLVKEHASWFTGGTWGMTDYDWFGDHEDLFRWWVDTWVRYVVEDGIDGYRLDVSMYRPDLWQEIKRRCAEAGHPIVVFHELGPSTRGVVDFLQRDIRLKSQVKTFDVSDPALQNMHRTVCAAVENLMPHFEVAVELKDGTKLGGEHGSAPRRIRIENARRESREVTNPRTHDSYGEDLYALDLSPFIDPATIKNLSVTAGEHETWMLHGNIAADFRLKCSAEGDRLKVKFPMKRSPRDTLSIQLSCHDDGWVGFPKGENPYGARGSRFVFGYCFMLTPAVPLFMSGEEFNADFVPLPRLSPGLFGGKDIGQGTWLYGSWLQWKQAEEPEHRAMLDDVRDIIRIRRDFCRLIRPLRREEPITGFFELGGHAPADLPVPYAFCDAATLLVVAGNPSTLKTAVLDIPLPLDRLPLRRASTYCVKDLWAGTPPRTLTHDQMLMLSLPIGPDRQKRGGLAVWGIEPLRTDVLPRLQGPVTGAREKAAR
jgi:hypothetical protein